MRKSKLISLVTALVMAVSMLPCVGMTARAASTTYVWDFTDPAWFASAINAGKEVISNQNETTAIMTNPGSKLSIQNNKVTDYALVAKTESQAANALQIAVPEGVSARISMQLTCGSSNQPSYLRDSDGTAVIDTTGYTKNVFADAYTAELTCGGTYTLDTLAGKAYIGRVELTVETEGGGDTPATTPPEATSTPKATDKPEATPTPTATNAPSADLQKMDYKMSFTFDNYKDAKFEEPVLLPNEDGDLCMKVYAASGKDVQVNGSNKTIGGIKFSTRLRLRGEGSVDKGYRCVEMIPAKAGSITVYFGHPSGSDPEPRTLYLRQDGDVQEAKVESNSETTARFIVNANASVYLYGAADVGVYCVTYIPGDTATPAPSGGTDSPKGAAQADADALKLRSLSQDAIYFDIDLPGTGENGSEITWESSNSKYIDIQMISSIRRNYTGVVTRPEANDAALRDGGVPVTLTATVKNGDEAVTKTFNVSVRAKGNVVYYNDFQQDVGQSAEGNYKAISDNVAPAMTADKEQGLDSGEAKWRSAPFRGIRIDTLKESRAFDKFKHNDKDTPSYFDKRVMSTKGTEFGDPAGSAGEAENFVFYYSEYSPYGGSSTIPMWIDLTDEATGLGPAGIIMMSMDIYVANGKNQLSLGLANSSPSQMCRFTLRSDHAKNLSAGGNTYAGAGAFRAFSNEVSVDFMGGTGGYRVPEKKWVKATVVANTDSHKWDMYFDGMQIASGLDFRNAEDYVSNIEFVLDRNLPGGSDAIAVYLIDNIYVENLTDDYSVSYWDSMGIDALKYDSANDRYVADSSDPFLLQYQGTEGLSGNYITWSSSNPGALEIKTQRVKVEELLNYGYTQMQVNEYLAAGVRDVAVVKAVPGKVTSDTTVTVKAVMKVGDDEMTKEFTVLVKANSEGGTPGGTPGGEGGGSAGGGGGGGGGATGGGATNPNAITGAPTPAPTDAPVQLKPPASVSYENDVFSDLKDAEWAKEAILYLYSQDIVNGYGDGLYGVSDSVTREQFVKMLLTALGFPVYKYDALSFTDVENGSWYEFYVETSAKLGIVNGISETQFGVGDPISRQDMAVMVKRALDYLNNKQTSDEDPANAEKPADTSGLKFTDSSQIADYAAAAVAEMANNGIINGDEYGAFRPNDNLTRAETAVVLYKILSQGV